MSGLKTNDNGKLVIRTVDDWTAACQRWGFTPIAKTHAKFGTVYVSERIQPGNPAAEHPVERQTHSRMLWAVETRTKDGVGRMDCAREFFLSAVRFPLKKDRARICANQAIEGFLALSAKRGRYGGN